MLRLAGKGADGRKIVCLGITSGNVARMAQGEPISVKLEEYGLDEKVDLVIFYGKDLESLQQQVEPFIGPNTKINVDPLLQSGVPEDARTGKEGQQRGSI